MPPSGHDDGDEWQLGVAEGLEEPWATDALVPLALARRAPGHIPGLIP
jgi:hypothetical protein